MGAADRNKPCLPSTEEFKAINRMCAGVSSTHKHDKWGIHVATNKFATSLETAYPVTLARAIAAHFLLALQSRGIKMPTNALADLSDQVTIDLPVLRAQTGVQPKASKLPPRIPTLSGKVALTGFQQQLPALSLHQQLPSSLHVDSWNAPTILPNGTKLLHIAPPLLPSASVQGGVFVSEQQLDHTEVERVT